MECPTCKFVAAPGQAAESGTCPNCERPYRDQPTPLNSDMEMRDMPEPGMEDTGGNPLQEGILGDFQNRGVRDEAFASVQEDQDPDFEVVDVVPPDPESLRPDKSQMDKDASFLDDVAPVAGGIVGGAVGTLLPIPGVGTAAGAAIGAGLAGGGVKALEGGDVGDVAGTGLTDAAIGGIGGGLAGGAAKLGTAAAADAAEQGATRGGIGSLMKSAWSKVPTQRIKDAYMMNTLLGGNGGGSIMPQAPQPQQNMIGAPPPPSFYSATETPTSHGEIPSNDTSDPEEVDFKEKNDGEKDGLQSDIGVNDIGGTDLGPDDFFSPDSGALASFADLLPKVLQFAIGDQSAAGDPDMEELHQKLEAEKPGYMNSADDDHGAKIVMMIMKGAPDGEGDDDLLQDNDTPHDPISEHEATALRPGLENTCPMCGGTLDPSTGHCPQCGMGNGRHMPQPTNPDFTTPEQMMNPPIQPTAAGPTSQGPVTDEQKAKVSELLQEQGRSKEIPQMIMEPWNYAKELAAITQREGPPQDIGQPGPPPPVAPEPPGGGMPMPGMSTGPQSGPQMMSAVLKYAATVDGFCEHCPKCGSHSTGYLDYEEGDAGCKTCGHKWKAPKMVEHSSADEDLHADPTPPEIGMEEPEQENGALSWTDQEGMPLKVGQTYEMYSNSYDIPDRVTINAVKPDVVEFTLVGEYGLSHQTKLTHEETQVEGTRFEPLEGEQEFDQAPEEAGQGAKLEPAPGDQTDLSTPHEMMTAKTANPESVNVEPNWESMRSFVLNMASTDPATAAKINQELGSEGVSEMELASAAQSHNRMIGPNDLKNTVREMDEVGELPETQHPLGPMTGAMDSHEIAMAPEVEAFFDYPAPEPQGREASAPAPDGEETGPAWLMDEVPQQHMAGAHMTPWEQRGFIDEIGDARNADKLQLGDTHYEKSEDLMDSFLFGL